MAELPGTEWRPSPWEPAEALEAAPMPASWRRVGEVRHGLSHFELRLEVLAAQVATIEADGFLAESTTLDQQALASVMRKCVALALRP
jgi:A/G-specific adenine glycosylase